MSELGPARSYASRLASFREQRAAHDARTRRIGTWRLALAAVVVATIGWASLRPSSPARTLAIAASGALVIAFVALVRAHRRAVRERRRASALVELQEEGIARLERRWSVLPPNDARAAPPDHAYANDLDVLGDVSLRRLLGPASPALGERRLHEWLLAPATPDAIRVRQAAARELAPMIDVRDALAVAPRLARALGPRALERLLAWTSERDAAIGRAWVLWGARVLGLATTVAFLVWLREPSWPAMWAVPAALNLALTSITLRRSRRAFVEAAGSAATLGAVAAMIEVVERTRFDSAALVAITDRLRGAAASLRELQRLVGLSELRYSPMMHGVVNAFTLLDVQVLSSVERWRERVRPQAAGWFDALAELEAMSAIATLAHDHPEWAFPTIVDGGAPVLEATALAHPLLPDAVAVANDVRVGPPGTFLLVTGSNMSGKSTLLRAIGANVVLAQAGAPVCASSLALPPLDVRTSVRVEDSLERGVSLFMAELLRLRDVVGAARRARATGGRTVLFLLDEILHGTNTAERQIAARRILASLVEEGAIGAVTTHDLALADAEPLRSLARPVHFTERFEPATDGQVARMTFDYVLRAGVATSVNALRLVEMVGLG